MKRTSIRINTLLLLNLLISSLLAVISGIPSAAAYDYGYGHASIIYTSQWNQTNDDIMRAQWASNDIYNLFAAKYLVYGHVENFHAAIYEWRVRSQAQHCEQNHPTTVIFYHGHAGKINITNNVLQGPFRYFIYEQAPQGGLEPPPWHPVTIDDYEDIYPYTLNNHRFVFIWACMQGNEVGGYTSAGGGYHRGMPYAWSHISSLSANGYAYPDTGNYILIGFENMSRSISYWPTPQNTYKNWLVFFYYFATNGYSIRRSLDEASKLVWGTTRLFGSTELYGGYLERNPNFNASAPINYPLNWEWWWSKMRVYGNGDRTLPY
ncbi:MAG: hypothetical protein QXD70_04910 [Candidatus Bathyarchaeia archaeon]